MALHTKITAVLLLASYFGFAQSTSTTYALAEDLLGRIQRDSVAWKYQTGATALSFSSYHSLVLQTWDKNGARKPNVTAADSLYFAKSAQLSAKKEILAAAKNAEVLIVNEAHHMANHRVFTHSLLEELYQNGYRYLGLEALADSEINQRKFATRDSGYYTQEPEFGNLIATALQLGYTLFGYEATAGTNGKQREIEQAQNIETFIKNNPKGKVLIHCGYAHAFEEEYPSWGRAMAGRLKENLGIDPLTVDQTMFIERSNPEFNHLYMRLNTMGEPMVLRGEDGTFFRGKNPPLQTDFVVIHPVTTYQNGQADWQLKGRQKYELPASKVAGHQTVLVLAYREKELESNGIPAAVVAFKDSDSVKELYLDKGRYTIVIQDALYAVIEQFALEIN